MYTCPSNTGFNMSKWTLIRVSKETLSLLHSEREVMLAAHERGQIDINFDARDRVSIDQVIARLISLAADHRQRAKRQRRKLGRDTDHSDTLRRDNSFVQPVAACGTSNGVNGDAAPE